MIETDSTQGTVKKARQQFKYMLLASLLGSGVGYFFGGIEIGIPVGSAVGIITAGLIVALNKYRRSQEDDLPRVP